MKCRGVQALLTVLLAGMFVTGLAQRNYYVVVGAFSTEGDAKNFTTYLPSLHADTAYLMTHNNNVVQLFVLRTDNQDVALAKSEQIQHSLEQVSDKASGYESIFIRNLPEIKTVSVTKVGESDPKSITNDAASSRSPSDGVAQPLHLPEAAVGKLFKFTIADPEGRVVDGKVHYVDFEQERDLASYPAHVYTRILNPGEKKDVAVVFGKFGYRQDEKYLNYDDPSLIQGAYRDQNNAWVIPYNLERLRKGDVSVMYNVSFHKDAAIMLPQSQVDLDELVNMMKENPNYEITIHGHCNGKHNRKITAMSNQIDFFTAHGATTFYGTARELSALRANAIRKYLSMHGIDERRVRIFAWGGRYKLVDPQSEASQLNDRIEIEIRRD